MVAYAMFVVLLLASMRASVFEDIPFKFFVFDYGYRLLIFNMNTQVMWIAAILGGGGVLYHFLASVNRDDPLSEEDIDTDLFENDESKNALLKKHFEAFLAYIQSRDYSDFYINISGSFSLVFMLIVLALLLRLWSTITFLENGWIDFCRYWHPAEGGWILLVEEIGGGAALGYVHVFVVAIGIVLPFLGFYLFRVFPRFFEANAVRSDGWRNGIVERKHILANNVASGEINGDATPIPKRMLLGTVPWPEWDLFTKGVLVFLPVTIGFIYLDMRDYDLFTEDHIEVVSYWTGDKKRFGYADVTRVEVSCLYSSRENKVSPTYRVFLPDGHEINIIHSSGFAGVEKEIGAYERIDERLVAAGVPVDFRRYENGDPRFSKECVEKLENKLTPDTYERLMRLLRYHKVEAAL